MGFRVRVNFESSQTFSLIFFICKMKQLCLFYKDIVEFNLLFNWSLLSPII